MSSPTTRQVTGSRADPDAVFTAEDLVLHLDRLRRTAAAGTSYKRVGLDQLAKATGIPRSTLHTYLSGKTLPPAAALDRLVLALGCDPGQVGAWAGAWERIADSTHGSRGRTGVSANSKLLSFIDRVRRQLDRPTDQAYEMVAPVVLFERVHIGANRVIASIDVRATVRALDDGADRFAIRIGPRPSIDSDRLELTGLVNCRAGQHRTLDDPRVRVLEAIFGHPLARGETYLFELRVDYTAAFVPGVPAEASTESLHGFLRRGPVYTLETRFRPDDLPVAVRQVQLGHAAAEENVVRRLRLNEWGAAHVTVDHPVAGLHGIRWDWPDAERRLPEQRSLDAERPRGRRAT